MQGKGTQSGPAQALEQNRAAISKLAQSGDAQRLMELADSLTEIKTVCACGRKATVNARIDASGRIITQGDQVFLGGNDSYVAMCHKCWKQRIREQAGE